MQTNHNLHDTESELCSIAIYSRHMYFYPDESLGKSLGITPTVTKSPECSQILSLVFIFDCDEHHWFQPWMSTCRSMRSCLLTESAICAPSSAHTVLPHTISKQQSLLSRLTAEVLVRRSSRLAQCPFFWPSQKHSCPAHFRPQQYKSFSWPVVLTTPIIFEPFQWFPFPLGHQAYCGSLNFQSPSWLTPNLSLFIHYQNINAQHQSTPDASFNWSIC